MGLQVLYPFVEAGKAEELKAEYRINWYIRPPFFIRPPPHIRPVLLLDLVAKGCTSYKTHKFKGVLHVK
jgi:hypothetical protein